MPNKYVDIYSSNLNLKSWASFTICASILSYFYAFVDCYAQASQSALIWLGSAWNPETDYEHGWLVPLIAGFLLYHAWQASRSITKYASLHGLWLLGLASLLALLAMRSQQARLAIAALPFFLLGLIHCYWGAKMARRCAFPCFYLWLCIPLPGLQQATAGLQIIATDLAQLLAQWCGVPTVAEGSSISSPTGQWGHFSVTGGCSGIHSLMALLMISTAWAYLAQQLRLWKRLLLALCAIPLAIVANALRVASIFIMAELVDPSFAIQSWHDWSGLLLFFPASLLGLALVHRLLAKGRLFKAARPVIIRKQTDPSSPS